MILNRQRHVCLAKLAVEVVHDGNAHYRAEPGSGRCLFILKLRGSGDVLGENTGFSGDVLR